MMKVLISVFFIPSGKILPFPLQHLLIELLILYRNETCYVDCQFAQIGRICVKKVKENLFFANLLLY